MRSAENYRFNSAYLEPYPHEYLRRAGYTITVHPSTASGRKPDFYAARDDGSLYLEAIAPAPSLAQQAKSARLDGLSKLRAHASTLVERQHDGEKRATRFPAGTRHVLTDHATNSLFPSIVRAWSW